jgi:putative membrane protein
MMYEWVKSLHLIADFAWMAGMLYLPRLFVYHATAAKGSELSETLKVMERRLLSYILNPAMILAWVFGVWLLLLNPALLYSPSLHVKFLMLFGMQIVHVMLARARREFANDENTHAARYFRILNEVPTVFLIVIVIMVVVKPFE